MRSRTIRISNALAGLVLGLLTASLPARAQELSQGKDLVEALRKGGYVIYYRHAATEHDGADGSKIVYDDCSTQRNLSEEGRKQARTTGAAMRKLGIPISEVVSSPFCRCIETAKLAFPETPAKSSDDLAFAIRTTESEAKRLGQALRKMLLTPPKDGGNTILIAHTANLQEAANVWPKPEGIMIVFKPVKHEEEDFAFVGAIKPDEWDGLTAGAAPAAASGR